MFFMSLADLKLKFYDFALNKQGFINHKSGRI